MRRSALTLVAVVCAGTLVAGAETSLGAPASQPQPPTSLPTPIPTALVNRIEEALQSAPSALGKGFSGAWVDPASQRVYVAFSDSGALERIKGDPSLTFLAGDPQVTFIQNKFSSSELDNILNVTAERLNRLLAPGRWTGSGAAGQLSTDNGPWPFVASVNSQDNVVDVNIQASNQAIVEAELGAELRQGSVRLRFTVPSQQTKACFGRDNCTPIRGGLKLFNNSGQWECSTGFAMKNPATSVRFMSTASHCAGTPWYHNGVYIGPTAWTLDSGNVDGKVIAIANDRLAQPNNSILRGGNWDTRITSKIASPSSSLVGNYLCSEGSGGGTRCGTLLSYNSTFNGRPGFGQINNAACPGDSGSPIVNNSSNRAYGILKGGPPGCAGPNWFTWTANLEAQSGYSLLLQTATARLASSQGLTGDPDQMLLSDDGRYKLKMQGDGNLVIYNPYNAAIWQSYSAGNIGGNVRMQSDGNLVVYDANGAAKWASSWYAYTFYPGSTLLMQNDGNLVIYLPNGGYSWVSNTYGM